VTWGAGSAANARQACIGNQGRDRRKRDFFFPLRLWDQNAAFHRVVLNDTLHFDAPGVKKATNVLGHMIYPLHL